MSNSRKTRNIPLPKRWQGHVRSAVLHVISLAQYTTIYTRGWAADSSNQRVRLKAEKPMPSAQIGEERRPAGRVVTAKHPNHIWHIDLTAIPTGAGPWCPWLPCALPQRWPFCWWVLVAVDHFSRVAVGAGVFAKRPDCRAVCVCLGQSVRRLGAAPKYIICDRESIFDCATFRQWAKRKGIQPPRYGAVGQHGSIAVVERFILTLKQLFGQLQLVPFRRPAFRGELDAILLWYNKHRPHTTLRGKTPHEAYEKRFPGNRKPRVEPRPRWPRGSPCARPQTLVAGKPGDRFNLIVSFQGKRPHLPMMKVRRAA